MLKHMQKYRASANIIKCILCFLVPAKILNISKTEVYKLNDNVALTCNVMGDPTPSISWTRTNYSNPLVPSKYQLSNNNHSLTIMNATLKERGTYICEAKNEYAKDTRNVTVNLEGIENYFMTYYDVFPCSIAMPAESSFIIYARYFSIYYVF